MHLDAPWKWKKKKEKLSKQSHKTISQKQRWTFAALLGLAWLAHMQVYASVGACLASACTSACKCCCISQECKNQTNQKTQNLPWMPKMESCSKPAGQVHVQVLFVACLRSETENPNKPKTQNLPSIGKMESCNKAWAWQIRCIGLAGYASLQPLQQESRKHQSAHFPHTNTTLKTLPAQRLHNLSCRGLACMDLDGCNVEAASKSILVLQKVLQQCRRSLGTGCKCMREWRGWKNTRVWIASWHCAKKHVVKHDVKALVTTSSIGLKLYVWNGTS